jgi:hypothetical protein
VTGLKARYPEVNFAVWRSEEDQRHGVDFIIWDREHTLAEFNLFIYQAHPAGKGLLVHQYAKRAYADKNAKYDKLATFMLDMKYTREALLTQVSQFSFPAITTEDTVPGKPEVRAGP